jgi:hypothetical protein
MGNLLEGTSNPTTTAGTSLGCYQGIHDVLPSLGAVMDDTDVLHAMHTHAAAVVVAEKDVAAVYSAAVPVATLGTIAARLLPLKPTTEDPSVPLQAGVLPGIAHAAVERDTVHVADTHPQPHANATDVPAEQQSNLTNPANEKKYGCRLPSDLAVSADHTLAVAV